jgi:hypothetical protein
MRCPIPEATANTRRSAGWLLTAFAAASAPAAAHHSFTIYDLEQELAFEGIVETLELRNPHLGLKLAVTKNDGTTGTIDFIEGPAANMLLRLGLDPLEISPGKPIRAVGSPLRTDPSAYLLKTVILPDGRRFNFVDFAE